jgi:hypothetical protein
MKKWMKVINMGFFQVDRNKFSSKSLGYKGKNYNKSGDKSTKSERLMKGIAKWASFYRANPQRFCKDYLGIHLKLFQQILLYMMFHYVYVMYIAARSQGKTFLTAIFCVCRCLLYPGTKVVVASGSKGQAMKIVTEKIPEIMSNSPNLKREIIKISTSMNTDDPNIVFANGSWIKVVASNDKARSARAHICVYDEFRIIDINILTRVLRRFLGTPRQPGYLKKQQYKHLQERNQEIYLSSAWFKSNWSWARFQSFFKMFTKGKKYFVCGLPYQLSVQEGLLMKEQVIDEMQEEDFDNLSWEMEMECMFFGESEKAYFKYDDLNKSRNLTKPFLPMTDVEYISNKGEKKKHKFYKPKRPDELRILGVDCALMGGRQNDASVYTFIRCIPNGDEYIKSIEYIEAVEGQHTTLQALRLKQLFYDLDCDFCVMDTAGNAIGIYDEITKITFDTSRGIEYPAWCAMNDDKMQERAYDKNAVPIIFSIKVAGATAGQVGHEMNTYVKKQFEKNKIKLLCSEIEGKDYISDNKDSLKLDSDETARFIATYFQTTKLIHEMINLEMETKGGYIKLTEPSGQRKDRWSSLSYALYFIKIREAELRVVKDDVDDLDYLAQYAMF